MRELILERRSIAQVARRYGKHRTTIWRWKKKWQAQQTVLLENAGRPNRPLGKTFRWNSVKWARSSAPHTHPNALDEDTVGAIMRIRKQKYECAEIIQYKLHLEWRMQKPRLGLTQKDAATTIFEAQAYMGIPFRMVQSDNGSEFQTHFQGRLHHSKTHQLAWCATNRKYWLEE